MRFQRPPMDRARLFCFIFIFFFTFYDIVSNYGEIVREENRRRSNGHFFFLFLLFFLKNCIRGWRRRRWVCSIYTGTLRFFFFFRLICVQTASFQTVHGQAHVLLVLFSLLYCVLHLLRVHLSLSFVRLLFYSLCYSCFFRFFLFCIRRLISFEFVFTGACG
jgi:hypothetical protein